MRHNESLLYWRVHFSKTLVVQQNLMVRRSNRAAAICSFGVLVMAGALLLNASRLEFGVEQALFGEGGAGLACAHVA